MRRGYGKKDVVDFSSPESRDDDINLGRRVRDGDEAAFCELQVKNLRFAAKVAVKFAMKYGIPYDDLYQEAVLGLNCGVRYYDPEQGNKFLTYGGRVVYQKVQEYVRWDRNSRGVSLNDSRVSEVSDFNASARFEVFESDSSRRAFMDACREKILSGFSNNQSLRERAWVVFYSRFGFNENEGILPQKVLAKRFGVSRTMIGTVERDVVRFLSKDKDLMKVLKDITG